MCKVKTIRFQQSQHSQTATAEHQAASLSRRPTTVLQRWSLFSHYHLLMCSNQWTDDVFVPCSFMMEYDIHTVLDALTLVATVGVLYALLFTPIKNTYQADLDSIKFYFVVGGQML
jgi:hypothetical protein